jgi:hypothetical protein
MERTRRSVEGGDLSSEVGFERHNCELEISKLKEAKLKCSLLKKCHPKRERRTMNKKS